VNRGIDFVIRAKSKADSVLKKLDSRLSSLRQNTTAFGESFSKAERNASAPINLINKKLNKVSNTVKKIKKPALLKVSADTTKVINKVNERKKRTKDLENKKVKIEFVPKLESVKKGVSGLKKRVSGLVKNIPALKLKTKFGTAQNSISELENKLEKLKKERNVSVNYNELIRLNRQIQKTENHLDKLSQKGRTIDLDFSPLETARNLALSLGLALTTVTAGGAIGAFTHLKNVSSDVRTEHGLLQQTLGLTGANLEKVTSQSIATAKVFNIDSKEMVLAAASIKNAYQGISDTDIFDLIQKGNLGGVNIDGGFIDKIKEYPTFFAQAGLKYDEMIAFMSQMPKMGILSDKGSDTIKESVLRLKEMPKATEDALKRLFAVSGKNGGITIDLKQFKNELKTGEKTVWNATKEISTALQFVDKQTRQIVMADVFSGAGEDAGKLVDRLHEIDLNIDNLIDNSNPLIAKQIKQIKLQKELATEAQMFAPIFNKMSDSVDSVFGRIQLKGYKMVNALQPTFERTANYLENSLTPKIEAFFNSVRNGIIKIQDNWVQVRNGIESVGLGLVTSGAMWLVYSNRVSISNAIDSAKLLLIRAKSTNLQLLNLQILRQNALMLVSNTRTGLNNTVNFARLLLTGRISNAIAMLNFRQNLLNAKTLIGTALTGGFTGAMTLLNTAIYSNPIGIVVVAIGGFVGALISAYNQSEKFRQIVWGVWGAVKVVFSKVWDFTKEVFGKFIEIFDKVGGALAGLFDGFDPTGAGNTKGFFGEVMEGFREGAKERAEFEKVEAQKQKSNKAGGGVTDNEVVPNAPTAKVEETKKNKPTKTGGKVADNQKTNLAGNAPQNDIFTGLLPPLELATNSGLTNLGGGGGEKKEVKNVNMTIENLVREIHIHAVNGQDVDEVREVVKEQLLRAVNGANEVYQ